MIKKLFREIFLFTWVLSKEAELPLCPTNILYFPQNLPMHCRMPTNADLQGMSGQLPSVPPFYQIPASDKRPSPPNTALVPPGMPAPIAMPGPLPFPGPMAIPGPTGPLPFPGPMPLPQGPAQKLPVIVMPFYSPDPTFKKPERPNHAYPLRPKKWKGRHKHRRPIYSSPDTSSSTDTDISSDTSSSTSSEYEGWWKRRNKHRRFNGPNRQKKRKRVHTRRQLLTPVLQYVTKDGYVIFEKKITKNEAKDWLKFKKEENLEESRRVPPEARDMESNEPNNNVTGEKDTMTDDNVEIITKKTVGRPNKIKVYRHAAAKKKSV